MKLIVHPETDKILGAHIVAPEAPEMIQFAAIAVKAGVTKAQWTAPRRCTPPWRRRW
jgi:glutathione reductase (NADPH)